MFIKHTNFNRYSWAVFKFFRDAGFTQHTFLAMGAVIVATLYLGGI